MRCSRRSGSTFKRSPLSLPRHWQHAQIGRLPRRCSAWESMAFSRSTTPRPPGSSGGRRLSGAWPESRRVVHLRRKRGRCPTAVIRSLHRPRRVGSPGGLRQCLSGGPLRSTRKLTSSSATRLSVRVNKGRPRWPRWSILWRRITGPKESVNGLSQCLPILRRGKSRCRWEARKTVCSSWR